MDLWIWSTKGPSACSLNIKHKAGLPSSKADWLACEWTDRVMMEPCDNLGEWQ